MTPEVGFRADTRYGPFRIGGRTLRAIPYGFLKIQALTQDKAPIQG